MLILIEERFPAVGADIVALGMAVIIGSILGGPILLKRAITAPLIPEPKPESETPDPESPERALESVQRSNPDSEQRPNLGSRPELATSVEADVEIERPPLPPPTPPDDWSGDA